MLFWIGSSTMFIQKLEILASSVFIADSLWKEIHRVERCCLGLGLLQCLSKNLKFWPAQCSLLIVFGKRFIVLDPMITKRIILSTGLDINLLIIWSICFLSNFHLSTIVEKIMTAVGYKYTEKELEWKYFVLTESTSHNLTVMEKSITFRTF